MSRIYLYAIVPPGARPPLNAVGVRADEPQVWTIRGNALAAVVGTAPALDFRALPREEAVRYLLAHQRVVEGVMQTSAALPVKFGTTLPDAAAVASMLDRAASVLAGPLAELAQYVQIELIVTWNIDEVVSEVAADQAVVRLKAQIAAQPGGASHDQRRAIGKMVKKAIDRRRDDHRRRILAAVRGVADDVVENALMDDRMIANLAVLVAKRASDRLDKRLTELDKEFGERFHFRCVGPLPPYSFATVEVSLPSFAAVEGARRALSLGESACLADIKSAYHRQIRRVHPDLAAGAGRQGEARRLTDAYNTLMHYAEALPPTGEDAGGESGYRFDRDAVESCVVVTVRRQTLPDARQQAQP